MDVPLARGEKLVSAVKAVCPLPWEAELFLAFLFGRFVPLPRDCAGLSVPLPQ